MVKSSLCRWWGWSQVFLRSHLTVPGACMSPHPGRAQPPGAGASCGFSQFPSWRASVKYNFSFGLCLHSPSSWNSLLLLKAFNCQKCWSSTTRELLGAAPHSFIGEHLWGTDPQGKNRSIQPAHDAETGDTTAQTCRTDSSLSSQSQISKAKDQGSAAFGILDLGWPQGA